MLRQSGGHAADQCHPLTAEGKTERGEERRAWSLSDGPRGAKFEELTCRNKTMIERSEEISSL